MARGNGRASGSFVQVLDHVPDRALRIDHPRRLPVHRDLSNAVPLTDVERARAHQAKIDSLWEWTDSGASETRFREAAEAADAAAEQADASEKVTRDVLLTQVGRALGLQGRFDEAMALLDAIPVDTDREVDVRATLERGRVIRSSGSPEASRPLFHVAYAAASAAGFEHLAVDSLHMMAIVADPSEQAPLNERALSLASTSEDPRAREWRATLLNNLGWARFDAGELDEALALFEDAVIARDRMGMERDAQIARWCVGRTLRELGRLDEALALQMSLADRSSPGWVSDSFVQEEIGECLVSLGRAGEAAAHFGLAADQLEAAGPGESPDPERLARLRDRASNGGDQISTTPPPGTS